MAVYIPALARSCSSWYVRMVYRIEQYMKQASYTNLLPCVRLTSAITAFLNSYSLRSVDAQTANGVKRARELELKELELFMFAVFFPTAAV